MSYKPKYADIFSKVTNFANNVKNAFKAQYADYFAQNSTKNSSVDMLQNSAPSGLTEETNEYKSKYADYKPMVDSAESKKNEAITDANKEREVSYADANASYLQNRANYGLNAEQISKMGLTGGGYSDYINSQAYAQKKNDVRYADYKANETINNAKATYADYLNSVKAQIETDNANFNKEGENLYQTYMQQAAQGYGSDYINAGVAKYGDLYGWNKEQTDALKSIADNYKETLNIPLADGTNLETKADKDVLQRQIESGQINHVSEISGMENALGDDYQGLVEQIQAKTYDELLNNENIMSSDYTDLVEYLLGQSGQVKNDELSEQQAINILINVAQKQIGVEDSNTGLDKSIDLAESLSEKLTENGYKFYIDQIYDIVAKRKSDLAKEKLEEKNKVIKSTPSMVDSATDLLKPLVDKIRKNPIETTRNTSVSGIDYYWDTNAFSLGKKAILTLSDGTYEEVYLKKYATPNMKKELGKGKEGEIKQGSDGSYYVYDGTASWVMLKDMDNGDKLKS